MKKTRLWKGGFVTALNQRERNQLDARSPWGDFRLDLDHDSEGQWRTYTLTWEAPGDVTTFLRALVTKALTSDQISKLAFGLAPTTLDARIRKRLSILMIDTLREIVREMGELKIPYMSSIVEPSERFRMTNGVPDTNVEMLEFLETTGCFNPTPQALASVTAAGVGKYASQVAAAIEALRIEARISMETICDTPGGKDPDWSAVLFSSRVLIAQGGKA